MRKLESSREDKAGGVTSEEMSEFYRAFLNGKRRDHLSYNLEWQKRNARIVWLSLLANLEDVFVERKK